MSTKRYCLILLQVCLLLPAVAQYKYQPFAQEGKMWECYDLEERAYCSYVVHDDTIINEMAYKKVFLTGEAAYGDAVPRYYAAVRDAADKKVYIVRRDSTTEALLYDFDIQDFATLILENGRKWNAYDPVLTVLNGVLRYKLTLQPYVGDSPGYTEMDLLEGVGTTYDPFRLRNFDRMLVACTDADGNAVTSHDLRQAGGGIDESYKPTLREGRLWNSLWVSVGGQCDVTFQLRGDTILAIGEQDECSYKKLYCKDERTYGDEEWHYHAAMREQGTDVYAIPGGAGVAEQQHYFSFSMQPGDKAYYADGSYIEAVGSDTIQSAGNTYRRIHVVEQQGEMQADGFLVEGIGSDCGGVGYPAGRTVPGWSLSLSSCYDGDVCIYRTDDIIFVGIAEAVNPLPTPVAYCDLSGRILRKQPMQKGIYIHNGQKVVVK